MGANPWHYFTPYQADINTALQQLKEQEFRAGRYGIDYWLSNMDSALQGAGLDVSSIPIELQDAVSQPKPSADELIEEYGNVEAAIAAVFEDAEADGTQSILDIAYVSPHPEMCAVCPLSERELQEMFQTTQPTRSMIEGMLLNETAIEDWEPCESFWESIERGEGRYIVIYDNGQPTELFFAGYSFD